MATIIERYEQLYQCKLHDSLVLDKRYQFPKSLMVLWGVVVVLWAVFFFHDYFVGIGWLLISLVLALFAISWSAIWLYRLKHTSLLIAREGVALLEGLKFRAIPYRDIQHVRFNDNKELVLESKTKSIRLVLDEFAPTLQGLLKILKARGFLDHEAYEHDIFFHDDDIVVEPVIESKDEDYLKLREVLKDYRYLHKVDLEDLKLQAIHIEKFKMLQKQHAAFFLHHLEVLGSHPLNYRFKTQNTDAAVLVFEHFRLLEILSEESLKPTLKAFRELIVNAQLKQCLISLKDTEKMAQWVFIKDHQSYTVRFSFDEVFQAFNAFASDPWFEGS